jgi:hypothetical protein
MATLEQWEQRLYSQIEAIQLIGELELGLDQVQELGQLIAAFVSAQEPQAAISTLSRHYPVSLAAFLVFQGGSSYHSNERADFWPGVCEAAGIPYSPQYTLALGQAFRAICRKFGLPEEFAGHVYVGAILGHGGIPARSLPDFFEHMLQPAVSRPELVALSTPDLIHEWRTGSARYHVDRPILRFLEYGGKVAEDFVERCRQMARAWAEEGEVPAADELGLPAALVDAYHEWVTQSSLARLATRGGLRLKKPAIVLDPWGLGVHVVLPEQQLPAGQSLADSWWEVEADGTIDTIPVDARRVDMDLKTRLAHASLRGPATGYRIRFYRRAGQTDAELLREWIYEGVSASYPFLAFDPQTGGLLLQPKRLPARLVWILCPPDGTLQADPPVPSLIREKLPPLPWDWHAWRGYGLDLQGVRELKLSSSFGQIAIHVVEAQAAPVAELVNAAQLDLLDDPVPFYVGAPPTLRIRTAAGDAAEARLERWRLELHHEWEADPKCDFRARLSELGGLVVQRDDYIELPLSHPRLLGAGPVGQYRIRVRGPLGSSVDLRFRIAPRLFLTGHEDFYLPEPGKRAPIAHLPVETDTQSWLEFLQNEPEFHLQELACDEQTRCYEVLVPPERADAPLRLVRQVGDGRSAFIPLRIPIRRLRWLLVLQPDQIAQPAWQSDPCTINLAELEQSLSPYLLLELPVVAGGDVTARLRFLDTADALIAELEAPRPSRPVRGRCFDLRSVRDALRMSSSPAIRVELQVSGLPVRDPLTLTILTIRRSIAVDRADVVLLERDGKRYVEVAWEPEIPLRWRQVRLWCQTRPWAEPLTVPIPDSARGKHGFPVEVGALPAGRYLIEFLVSDPWLPETMPIRPQPTAPNVKSAVIGSLEERLAELEAARREGKDAFSCACESAFLWHELGEIARAEASLQACWECLDAASLQQMMALARTFEHLPTGKAFRIKLYRTEQIREILAAYREARLPEPLVAEYFAGLPPLAKLAPQAVRALLDAPDERVQLAAAQHLIAQNDLAGIRAAFAWEASGRLSRKGLDELLELNLPLARQFIASQLSLEESIRLIQTSDSWDIKLAAATTLVDCDQPEGVLAVLRLYERSAISGAQAISALRTNPRLAARLLSEQPSSKAAASLLAQLLDAHPDALPLVQAGVWVGCNLGWAQIDHVETSDGQRIASLAPEKAGDGVRIAVTFHPGANAIKALIDTAQKRIVLLEVKTVYQCLKCNRYIAARHEKIIGEHDRTAHEGMHPSFRPLVSPIPLVGHLEFRYKPPV